MRETIEALLKRVRRLAEAFAGEGGREEWEETEEDRETPEARTRRRRAARREPGSRKVSRKRGEEEETERALSRREMPEGMARRQRESRAGEDAWDELGHGEAMQLRQDTGWDWELREEPEEQAGTGRGGDAREYGFGDGTDPSRYFYSEDYIERLSGYLETDARRYGPQDME